MRRIDRVPAIALVGGLLGICAAPAPARETLDLENWDYDELRTGWSVERLTEAAEVVDQDGETIGRVKDLIRRP